MKNFFYFNESYLKEIDKLNVDIGVLVNNVGMMGPHFIPFLELDEATARNMIIVNCLSATMMTHHILPKMIAKNKGANRFRDELELGVGSGRVA